jgi:hypothetical protein
LSPVFARCRPGGGGKANEAMIKEAAERQAALEKQKVDV